MANSRGSEESQSESKLDDETRRLVMDVLDLLKSSSGSAILNNKDLPGNDTKKTSKLITKIAKQSETESYCQESESPSTSTTSSFSSSSSSKSAKLLKLSPPTRRVKRTEKTSPSSRMERVLQLSPITRRGRTVSPSPLRWIEKETTEDVKGIMKSSFSRRKERTISTSPTRRKERTISTSPTKRRKERTRHMLSSSPTGQRKERTAISSSLTRRRDERTAMSSSPTRRRKERTSLSSSPEVRQEVIEEEKKQTKSPDKSGKKRRGRKPKSDRVDQRNGKLDLKLSKTSSTFDGNRIFAKTTSGSLGDLRMHEMNYRYQNTDESQDIHSCGHLSSRSASSINNIVLNHCNDTDDINEYIASLGRTKTRSATSQFSKAEDRESNSSPKSPLPRRSIATLGLKKTPSHQRGTTRTETHNALEVPVSAPRSRSPNRMVRRSKSDTSTIQRTAKLLSSPHPRRNSVKISIEGSKSSSPPSSSVKKSTIGKTKSDASLIANASSSACESLRKERSIPSPPLCTSLRKERTSNLLRRERSILSSSPPKSAALRKEKSISKPKTPPPPPLLLDDSSHHLSLFLDEEEEDEDSNGLLAHSWRAESSHCNKINSSKPITDNIQSTENLSGEEECAKPQSSSSFASSSSNFSAGGKVRNIRTHEVYTGFFLLSEEGNGKPVNLKHGYGRTKFPDGRVFEGTYDRGTMMEGKMTYPADPSSRSRNGEEERPTYVGKFDKQGFRCGKGIYTTSATTYLGDFFRDEMHGSGILIYHNLTENSKYGRRSSDESKNSKGRRFVGHWKDGLKHGVGKEVRVDGTIQREGVWRKGRFCGRS